MLVIIPFLKKRGRTLSEIITWGFLLRLKKEGENTNERTK